MTGIEIATYAISAAAIALSGLSVWFTIQARRNWRRAEANWNEVARIRRERQS